MRNLAAAVLLGSVGIAAVVLVTGGRIDLGALRSINRSYILACAGLVALDWLSEAVRLRLLCRALGEEVSISSVLRIVFLGVFFARITPFDSGGEPFQVYALHRNGVPLGHATAMIAVKALLHGLARVSLGILVPVWLILTAKGWHLSRAAAIALYAGMAIYIGVFVLVILMFVYRGAAQRLVLRVFNSGPLARLFGRRRLDAALARLEDHYRAFVAAVSHFGRERRGTILAVTLISFVSWSAVLAVPVILVRALGGASPLAEVAATAIIFYLAVAYAPTPGSSGAAEIGFATLFARFVPLPLVGVLVLLWRLLTHYLSLLLGFMVTAFSMFGRRPKALPPPQEPALAGQPGSDPAAEQRQP